MIAGVREWGAKLLPHNNPRCVCPPGILQAGDGKPILVPSLMRSGTHLLIDLILNNFSAYRRNPLYIDIDRYFDEPLSREPLAHCGSYVIKTHFPQQILSDADRKSLEELAGRSHIIRPVRRREEVLHSLLDFGYDGSLEELDGIFEEAEAFWSHYPTLDVPFERMADAEESAAVVREIAGFIGLPPADPVVPTPDRRQTGSVLAAKMLTRTLGAEAPRINTTIRFARTRGDSDLPEPPPVSPVKASSQKVAAVFATMNRRETAATCLARLAAQTRRPWKVVVVDNASSDDTVGRLRAPEFEDLDLEVIASPENLGNAGGVELAMERAFELGADAVWILDDDSWPEAEALEELLHGDGPATALRSSLVVDPDTGRPSWPAQIASGQGWRLTQSLEAGGPWVWVRRSWLGALIPREARQKVGPVIGELFLRGEDEDYPRRLEKAGYRVAVATRSILHHPPGGKIHRLPLLDLDVILEEGLEGARLYYRLRNAWWLTKRDRGAVLAFSHALLHLLMLVIWERPLGSRLRVWKEALRDAFADRLGRRDDLS